MTVPWWKQILLRWYEWVYYRTPTAPRVPFEDEQ